MDLGDAEPMTNLRWSLDVSASVHNIAEPTRPVITPADDRER